MAGLACVASRRARRRCTTAGDRSRTARDRQRLRSALVVGQIAGSLALLTVAALFAQTLAAAKNIDLGFDADHLITVRLDARQVGYDEARADAFYDELAPPRPVVGRRRVGVASPSRRR